MKKLPLLWLSFFLMITMSYGQNYTFQGTMSREVLENYLSKSITMAGLVNARSCYWGCAAPTEYDLAAYNEDITMLKNLNARFIGRAALLWGGEGNLNIGYWGNVKQMVVDIDLAYANAGLERPIIQAGIMEYVTTDVNHIKMNKYVASAYPETAQESFDYSLMLTNVDGAPDISQPMTQMWFYHLATEYIMNGIEALHFGNMSQMARNDPNNIAVGDLLSKVRTFAAQWNTIRLTESANEQGIANRGLVLCDAHHQGYFNDPVIHNKLLYDFHSSPLRIKQDGSPWPGSNPQIGPAILDATNCSAPYGKMGGGITYSGWSAPILPYLVEFDNYGNKPNGGSCFPWGRDEITWFGYQIPAYRNTWLKYAWFKTKCLDKNAFLQMPGRRGMAENAWPDLYRAAAGGTNSQVSTIDSLWKGKYNEAGWNHYNFSKELVMNAPDNVHRNLLMVGNDKMYYIGDDGRIHGYVLYNGTWFTVSPSYSAQSNGIPVSNQAIASSSLIASPDGTKLYYIGSDGYLHGFDINSLFSYSYYNIPTAQMIQQNIKAVSDLIPSGNNRLFYIAKGSDQIPRVHGFYKDNGQWLTVSPTYSAQIFYGQSASSQDPAAGDLVLSPDGQTIYYRGSSGFMFGFNIISDGLYTYFAMPNTQLIQQNVRVAGKIVPWGTDRMYYIGQETGGAKRVHGFYMSGGQWLTISPSWSANVNGTNIALQVQVKSDLSISPDGKRIAYIGTDNQVHGFNVVSLGAYTYMDFKNVASPNNPTNDLILRSKNELFYISNQGTSKKVHSLKFEGTTASEGTTYCGNTNILAIEPGFTARVGFNDEEENLAENPQGNSLVSSIYPNPVNDIIFFKRSGDKEIVRVSIVNMQGIKVKEVLLDNASGSSAEIAVDVQSLANGLYSVLISSEDGLISQQKILIIH